MATLAPWISAGALFVEVLALVLIGRCIAQVLSRRKFDHELASKDNPAAALAIGGYHLGLFIALGGLLAGGPITEWEGMVAALQRDALLIALHGFVAIACLLASAWLWRPILGIDLQRDLFEGRNVAGGLVCGSGLVATGLIYAGSVQGEGHFGTALAFFGLGQGALFVTSLLYERVTPYHVGSEIAGKQNLAAAIGYSGALIAAGIIVGHAATGDFTTWHESTRNFFKSLIPLAAFPLVRWIVADGILLGFRNVNTEISRDRNTAAGVLEAVAYVGSAIFVTRLI